MGGLGIVFFVVMPFCLLFLPLLPFLNVAAMEQGVTIMDFLDQFFAQGASFGDLLSYIWQIIQGLSASEFFGVVWEFIKSIIASYIAWY